MQENIYDENIQTPAQLDQHYVLLKDEKDQLRSTMFPNMEILNESVAFVSEKLLHNPKIFVFQKECHQKRDVGFFCDDPNVEGYIYSGQIIHSQPCNKTLQTLIGYVNNLFGSNFNAILVNRYNFGYDYIGKHSDDERNLCRIHGVVSISYGAERILRIRDKRICSKKIVCDHIMKHGECVQMYGEFFQRKFTHEIPKQTKVKESRISFTFRHHNM